LQKSTISAALTHLEIQTLTVHCGATLHNTSRGTKQNIALSFDPKTITCTSCDTKHSILNTYRDQQTHPLTVAITDQNFNSHSAGFNSNSLCIKTIRIEDGSLGEGVDMLFKIFGKDGVPAGTVFLMGSASDLIAKGSSRYASEFIRQKLLIENRWMASRVCLLPPVLVGGGLPAIFRCVTELRGWITTVLGMDPTGLLPVWNVVMSESNVNILNTGTEDDYYTVQFPGEISANPKATYVHYAQNNISPAEIAPLSRKANIEIVRALFKELNTSFSCGLGPGVNLERADDSCKSAKDPTNYIVIGASHMKQVASVLSNAGNEVLDLAEKSWVLSDSSMHCPKSFFRK
jgi:hypothetical protein